MPPILLTELQHNLPPSIDLFITSASFEERCLSIINSLEKNFYKKVWICYNHNEQEFFSDNVNKLLSYNENCSLLEFSTDDPMITATTLLNHFSEVENPLKNILIDITTFTHEGLLILFKYIDIFSKKMLNIYVGYTGAADYDVNEKNQDKKWLTKGIKTIRSILGYPGILNPSRKNHLIVLFGFESERTKKLIENFDAQKISLGFGPEDDSITNIHYQINRTRHLELLSIYPSAEKFEFSLTDPLLTRTQISNHIDKFPGYNIVIAAMNTKLSTLGAALVALERKDVQLCYVRAHQYNLKGYSAPSDKCYLIKWL